MSKGRDDFTDTVECYRRLQLEFISSEWTERVLDGNFCVEVENTPDGVLQHVSDFSQVVDCTRKWINRNRNVSIDPAGDDESSPQVGFWTVLYKAGVCHKTLLAVIYALLDRNKSSLVERVSAVYCSQLYFTLLQVPGTTAYKTFHPMLFQKALDVFNMYPDNCNNGRSKKRSHTGTLRTVPSKRSRGIEDIEEGDDSFEEGEEEEVGGASSEANEQLLMTEIKHAVRDLLGVLHCYSLMDHEVTRHHIASDLLRLTRLDSQQPHERLTLSDNSSNITSRASLCYLVWACLDALCTPRHGSIEKTITEIFHQLLPYVTMVTSDGGVAVSGTIPPFFGDACQQSLKFIEHIVSRCGSSAHVPLKILIQHVCAKTPDRAEFRSKIRGVVCTLLGLFDDDMYKELVQWLVKYSRNVKISCRMISLEVISEMLLTSSAPSICGRGIGCGQLLRVIVNKCSDKSSNIRSRALSCLSSVADCHDNTDLLKALCDTVFINNGDSEVMAMLCRRASDIKANVRKSAVQAMAALIMLREDTCNPKDVSVIHERCMDKALSVRKQAMTSITELAVTFNDSKYERLHRLWLDGVLPSVMDREESVKEKCLSVMEEVILYGIRQSQRDMEIEGAVSFAWRLLNIIAEDGEQDLRRCLQLVLHVWSKGGKITPTIIQTLVSHTNTVTHKKAAWMLLAELSTFSQFSIDSKFLWTSWSVAMDTPQLIKENEFVAVCLLRVMGNSVRKLGRVAIGDVKDQILKLLSSFQLPISVVSNAITALTQCANAAPPTRDSAQQSIITPWLLPLLKQCEDHIDMILSNESHDQSHDVSINEDELIAYLYTLGETCQLLPGHTSSRTALLLQSLLLSTGETPLTGNNKPRLPVNQLSGLKSIVISPKLRAHAHLALGKLCLQEEELAKDSLVLMSCDLQHTKSPVIRNNIVIIMSDLAVRYSAKVDPYIPLLAMCLKDESLLVRKQTLTTLARLLQEDYIKSKGAMFFHFLFTLTDNDLKQLSEFCLLHLLLARNAGVFYQNFIECIFHFNDYRKHRAFNQFSQSDKEREMFSLAGDENANKRRSLYSFLLTHLIDEHRFQLTAKLCQEVLGGIIDDVIPFDSESVPIIRDTLEILACKEIKLSTLRWSSAQEDAADEDDVMGVAMAKAQNKMMSHIVKKNVMENIVPIIVAVKHRFEKERSPLLKDLLKCLKELMQDYRSEIKEVLMVDQQLAEEIEFDLRRFEQQQKQAVSHNQTSSMLHSGIGKTPLVVMTPKLRERHRNKLPSSTQQCTTKPKNVAISSPLVFKQTEDSTICTPRDSGQQIPPGAPRTLLPCRTPVFNTPRANLMKTAILASARKKATASDDPLSLMLGDLRVASTPHDGAMGSITFNTSSILPPSPIPHSSVVKCFMQPAPSNPTADISMRHPEKEPDKIPKWDIE